MKQFSRLFRQSFLALVAAVFAIGVFVPIAAQAAVQNPQSGSTGIEGKISAPPPTTPATISIPGNGQTIANIPVTVSGLCSGDLLVKVFKNNVFAGSVQCKNGSYSILIDLFNGKNDLVSRVYDALDQAGPDSNTVSVFYNDNKSGTASRVSMTSVYAKRGANPGQVLTWPITLTGGEGPYAISVDWGDGKTPDLKSEQFAGNFDITHTYDSAGVYNIVIKATDKNGGVAYLQLVGVGNGALSQDTSNTTTKTAAGTTTTKTKILWEPAAILLPMILTTFWLGKRHELKTIRRKIEQGDRPF